MPPNVEIPREVVLGPRDLIPHPDEPYSGPVIKPQEGKPTVVRPADFQLGHIELGFNGEPADCLLFVNAAGIAGDGPTTQACQVSEGLKKIANFRQPLIPLYYLGPETVLPDFAELDFTGGLPEQKIGTITLTRDATIPKRYQEIARAIFDSLNRLTQSGNRRFLVVSTGYTAFVPFGVKKAVKTLKQRGLDDLRVKLVIQDSSFPDTDNPSNDLDEQGYPLDRFYYPAYASTENVEVWLLTNTWPFFNIKWARRRAPPGTLCTATSFPFTAEYCQRWVNWREVSQREAKAKLASIVEPANHLYAVTLRDEKYVHFGLFASNGYFNHDNIGKWMTKEQYDDMVSGVRNLLEAAKIVADTLQRPVVISGVEGFVNLALQQNIAGVAPLETVLNSSDKQASVFLTRVPRFPQSQYGLYHRALDVGIHRTTQANAAAEGVLAGATQVYLTMPAHGYMDAPKMDRGIKVEGMRQYEPTTPPEKLAERFLDILTIPWERESLKQTADNAFLRVWKNRGTNFMAVLAYLTGFRIE